MAALQEPEVRAFFVHARPMMRYVRRFQGCSDLPPVWPHMFLAHPCRRAEGDVATVTGRHYSATCFDAVNFAFQPNAHRIELACYYPKFRQELALQVVKRYISLHRSKQNSLDLALEVGVCIKCFHLRLGERQAGLEGEDWTLSHGGTT